MTPGTRIQYKSSIFVKSIFPFYFIPSTNEIIFSTESRAKHTRVPMWAFEIQNLTPGYLLAQESIPLLSFSMPAGGRPESRASAVGQPASHLRPLLKRVLFFVCRVARLLSMLMLARCGLGVVSGAASMRSMRAARWIAIFSFVALRCNQCAVAAGVLVSGCVMWSRQWCPWVVDSWQNYQAILSPYIDIYRIQMYSLHLKIQVILKILGQINKKLKSNLFLHTF